MHVASRRNETTKTTCRRVYEGRACEITKMREMRGLSRGQRQEITIDDVHPVGPLANWNKPPISGCFDRNIKKELPLVQSMEKCKRRIE